MSEENVETVRRAWQAFVTGGIEASFDFWTEECIFEDFRELPESAVYVGRTGLTEAVEHFTEMWSDLSWEPLEFIDAGENRVIAVIGMRGKGGTSGAPMDARAAWLYEMRSGRVSGAKAFTSKQEALKAAGLSE